MRILLILLLQVMFFSEVSLWSETRGSAKIKIFKQARRTVHHEDRNRAIKQARQNALKTFSETALEPPDKEVFFEKEAQILSNLDSYILNVKILREDYNRGLKTFSVLLSIEFSRDKILHFIRDKRANPLNRRHAVGRGKKKRLVTLYFVRRIERTDMEKDRVKTVEKSRVREGGTDDEEGGAYFSENNRTVEKGSYKSLTKKAAKDSWSFVKTTVLQSSLNKWFSNYGFKPVSPGSRRLKNKSDGLYDYGNYKSVWKCEFVGQEEDCDFETIKEDAKEGLQIAGIDFVSFATLSVYQQTTDEDSGLPSVDVRAEAEIFDLGDEWVELVASSNQNSNGVGRDYNAARDIALTQISKEIVDSLVGQLSASASR
jgi:hypothetical protein